MFNKSGEHRQPHARLIRIVMKRAAMSLQKSAAGMRSLRQNASVSAGKGLLPHLLHGSHRSPTLPTSRRQIGKNGMSVAGIQLVCKTQTAGTHRLSDVLASSNVTVAVCPSAESWCVSSPLSCATSI